MNRSMVEMHDSAASLANASALIDRTRMITPPAVPEPGTSTDKPAKIVTDCAEDKKKRRKKKWKKPKDKPNRPLSAYNLFFRSERAQMLGDDAPTPAQETLKKRVHCKTHGKIGFADMARNIGARWKALDPALKKRFVDQAQKEKERYAAELATWKTKQKDEDNFSTSNNGLEAMATAAMASDLINAAPPASSNLASKPSDSLKMMIAEGPHRNNIAMLQSRAQDFDYIRALQSRSVDPATILGLPHRESPLMKYPSAAEASANVIMNHFQGIQHSPHPSPAQTGGLQMFYEVDRLSQLMVMRRLQQQRYLASGKHAHEYGVSMR
jgi:hypothetical protein